MTLLQFLPCLDSDDMASARQRELDIRRQQAALLGLTAVAAIEKRYFLTKAGVRVDWGRQVLAACAAKVSIPPDATLPESAPASFQSTRVQVSNETTFGAARRLVDQGLRPLALNLANGIQPGGGSLHGSRAQEEALCRSSALYQTLVDDPMYEAHRQRPRPDSTDWAILSPRVPVFRHDDGTALDELWLLDFLTCAAPFAPGVGQPESGDLLQRRIHRILDIARAYGYSELVLGAWGCGAFPNDPVRTTQDFRAALESTLSGAFSEVVFAIADWSPERRFLGPFRDTFSDPA